MKFIKNIIEHWKYNNSRDNIEQRTFIAHQVAGGENLYGAAINYKRWNGKVEYKIKSMKYNFDNHQWELVIGGHTYWIHCKDDVKQALDDYIDLQLGRGKYAKKKKNEIRYEKYP